MIFELTESFPHTEEAINLSVELFELLGDHRVPRGKFPYIDDSKVEEATYLAVKYSEQMRPANLDSGEVWAIFGGPPLPPNFYENQIRELMGIQKMTAPSGTVFKLS